MLMNLGEVCTTFKRFESLCKEENWQKRSIKTSRSSKIESDTPSSSLSCRWISPKKTKFLIVFQICCEMMARLHGAIQSLMYKI